jgi:hypothetical protein
MLAVLREIGANMVHGVIQRADFKVVYVAPMKALAAEVTANFGKRLQPLGELPGLDGSGWAGAAPAPAPALVMPAVSRFQMDAGGASPSVALVWACLQAAGLSVRELTGDMQLSKKELAETQAKHHRCDCCRFVSAACC